MSDKTKQALTDALDRLTTGNQIRTNGKLNATNIAREANIGRATLYRFLREDSEFANTYRKAMQNVGVAEDPIFVTPYDSIRQLTAENKRLRADAANAADVANKQLAAKNQLIAVLWKDNRELKKELEEARKKITGSNVVHMNP